MQTIYETERLILRVLGESYGALVLDYFVRNKDFLREWEPSKPEYFYSIAFQAFQMRNDFALMNAGTGLRFWVFKKSDRDLQKIIGSVGMNNIIRGAFLSCHLGYKLDHEETNKGYMTEAVKKAIEIMFDEHGLHRIEANIMPKNKPSLQVVEKLGFQQEGLARKYLKINGQWEDHMHMVLLNEAME